MNLLKTIFVRFLKLSLVRKILLIVIIIGIGWFTYPKIFKPNNQPQYQTVSSEKGTIISSVSASGNVLTANLINITTNASGVVKKVYVKDDDLVVKDQIIAEIALDREGQQKNASSWSSYLSSKNSVDLANATFYNLRSGKDTAWKKFYDLAVGSAYQNSDGSPKEDARNSSAEFQSLQADWLAAETKSKNQESVINQTKSALNSSWLSYQSSSPTISTPINGTISNLGLVEGMVLNPQSTSSTTISSQRVAVIQNDAKPIVNVILTEIDIQRIKIGQKVTITLDSLPDKTFTGKVMTVDRIGTTTNNVTSYPSIIQLDIPSSDILPNMTINASIIINVKNNAVLVPSGAVQTSNGQSAVRIMKNGQVTSRQVEIGLSNDTQTEILSGISEADVVITADVALNNNQPQGQTTSPFGGFGGQGGFGGGAQRR